MQCSNCGKEIPFEGKVCPYCHADKSADQRQTTAINLLWGGILFGGILGFGLGPGSSFVSSLIGSVVGAIVGAVCALYIGRKLGWY